MVELQQSIDDHANAEASTSATTLEDLEFDDDRELLILYASQTGCAQDVADFIAREAWRRHFSARVMNVQEFDKADLLDSPPTIIVTSTTGQGHFPSSILTLWNFLLRSDLPEGMLHDFNYAIFGLGDSSYPKYNWPARKLSRRLEILGAQELVPKGEADDQHYLGIDGTLHPWLETLWSTLLQHFPLPAGKQIREPTARPPPRLRFSKSMTNGHITFPPVTHSHGMQPATLRQNKRVTAEEHFQDTRHIVLELEDAVNYKPGDILDVRPENLPEDVDAFLTMMKWQDIADTAYRIESTSHMRPLPPHWPEYITLRQLFTRYLDIFSVPRRSFFEWLSYFTTSELETEKLQEFCTAEGQEDMYDYANRPRRTIQEILQEFRSAHVPLEYIADIFPEIRPRQFSIASSSRKNNNKTVELLVAIVKYRTKLKASRKGVATAWLASLKPGQKLSVGLTNGTMEFPADPATPVILIGPGTGIAPFRSFVQDRMVSPASGEILVFFGCRSTKSDFYFADEWAEAVQATKGKCRLVLAASREQEDKVYVQHKIAEEAEAVWRMLGQQDGRLYISGASGQMPKAVQKALKKIFQEQGGMSEEEAEKYFDQMEKAGRYQEETWS